MPGARRPRSVPQVTTIVVSVSAARRVRGAEHKRRFVNARAPSRGQRCVRFVSAEVPRRRRQAAASSRGVRGDRGDLLHQHEHVRLLADLDDLVAVDADNRDLAEGDLTSARWYALELTRVRGAINDA